MRRRLGTLCQLILTASAIGCAASRQPPPAGVEVRPAASAAAIAPSTLQAGPFALDQAERAKLDTLGFVISDRRRFPSFVEGWLAIYKADLPLYVSADALLHVLHRAYDAMLKDIEKGVLVPRLEGLIVGMRTRLAGPEGAALSSRTRADADFFLGVAASLLDRSRPRAVAGANAAEMDKWVRLVFDAKGAFRLSVFGTVREVDFSQFKPRGHYESSNDMPSQQFERVHPGGLSGYFRAVTWLGRTDLRMTGEGRYGVLELRRRELELACALTALMGPDEIKAWHEIEATMTAFVGEPDAMGPADVARFYRDLGIANVRELAAVPDAKILETIARGKYGYQRISSQITQGDLEKPAPRASSFSFTGQRYIVDSEVLSDLVYDRVTPPPGKPPRLMPNPLDAAFAALGNDDARALLAQDIETYGYGPNLEQARKRVDGNGAGFWDSSLYNLWLGSLRTLSLALGPELPQVFRSEAWKKRVLSTELASWAELRHDTILYAKQSYTASITCSFPDVYVDPYPEFYERLGRFADRGKALVGALDLHDVSWLRDKANGFFGALRTVATRLGHLCEGERRGERPSKEDLEFVNRALFERPPGVSCGYPPPRDLRGWYVDLLYDGDPLAVKPTIADVHTQPTDAEGDPVGRVLHVGTGFPRTMVVSVNAERTFVGLVYDYAEVTTDRFQRLSDSEWIETISNKNPDDVVWMRDVVVR